MGFYLSPLVDVQERDLTLNIQAAATSIGAIILRNPKKGPEMKKTLITSVEQFIDTFGSATTERCNYIDTLSAIGALKYMNKLYCTAIKPKNSTYSGLVSSYITSGADEIASFAQLETTGEKSLVLSDFKSEDPDYFADEVLPVGPVDMISLSRGSIGNRIRVAMINNKTYDKIVRKEENILNYEFGQKLFTIDSSLDVEDNTNFLLIVQFLPEGKDGIKETEWEDVEYWNVSTKIEAVDEQGLSKFVETKINDSSKYIRIALNETQKNKPFTVDHKEWLVFGGGFDGAFNNDEDELVIKGLNLYRNPEEVDVNIFIDSDKSETVKLYINSICEERKDCMGIIDCKYEHVVNNKGSETTSLVRWRKGLNPFNVNNFNISSDRVALYANWLEVYDEWNGKYRWIPASGYVAGIFANNDSKAEAWFAPAGLNRALLNNVRRLAFNPTLGERDLLYLNGWNPILSFAGQGKVIWGQKTALDKPSAFNRINVRRLFLVLEKSIATTAKYYLFEPNDAITRINIIGSIEPFLREVQARRGIYDFQVVCDDTNNTPERIDNNELWVDIKIKPTRTAEYCILRFSASQTGANFTEITG